MPMPNRVPQMAAVKDLTLTVAPAGGINYSRLENRIDDGQLSAALNFWYKDNLLRMRPGLVKRLTQTYGRIVQVAPSDGSVVLIRKTVLNGVVTENRSGIYILTEKALLSYDGNTLERVPTDYDASGYIYADIDFSVATLLPGATFTTNKGSQSNYVIANTLLVVTGSTVYQLEQVIKANDDPTDFRIILVPISDPQNPFYYVMVDEVYVPTTYTNMTPNKGGDQLEARNFLTPWVKNEFITDNSNTVYQLMDQELDTATGGMMDLSHVEARYDNLSGQISLFEFFSGSATDTKNGITATLDRNKGTITFSAPLANAAAGEAKVPNMTVTYAKTVYAAPCPVAKCRMLAWFGGAHQGEKSGDCVFAAGNPDEPNAVYWSAVADSTYWPDDNVDYVGAPADPITAFGKVFGSLVIFKQSSVYEKGFTWDSTNSKQYFPTSEIRVGMGCDCPGSIQLVNNALVWLNSRLGMLVLTTTSTSSSTSNIYTERVIQPLSANINPGLLAEALADRQGALSVDDGQYYRLFVGKHVYLWDYATTPFINLSDTSRLQDRLAWYVWSIPHDVSTVFLRDTAVWVVAAEDSAFYAFDGTAALDEGGTWFEAYLITKGYDFGASNLLKQMYFAAFTLANKDTVSVGLSVIDDQDTSSREEVLDGHDMETVSAVSYWEKSSFTRAIKLEIQRPTEENGSFAVAQIELRAKLGRAA